MVFELVRKAMLASLGAQERAKEFVDDLIKRGELSKSEGATLLKEWMHRVEQSSKEMDARVKDLVRKNLERLNLPTREDMDKLNRKVQALAARVRKLEGTEREGD